MLSEDATNHVGRVLRMNEGDAITLFDGSNHIFHATLQAVEKKQIIAKIHTSELDDRESPLAIHLGQVISRGDRIKNYNNGRKLQLRLANSADVMKSLKFAQ